ncbi:hypothetical protein OXX69_004818 [Metschnikowia pulcherrima]
MSNSRPKRKATANKSYVDTTGELLFEQAVLSSSNSSKSSSSSGSNSKTANGLSGQKSPRKKSGIAPERTNLGSATPPNSMNPVIRGPGSGSIVHYNWQPPITYADEFSHKLDFTDATVNTMLQVLTCPRHPALMPNPREEHEMRVLQNLLVTHVGQEPEPLGPRRKQTRPAFQIKKGDYIYMVSEPPGEPYYIGRIMGFKRKDEKPAEKEVESATEYMFQIQWFYRPRDISKHTLDSRLLFASMHSDSCPLSSFRGLLTVLHKSDVEFYFRPLNSTQTALEYYASFPNCFYFDKLYDRYILKFYDVVKTSTLLSHIDNAANCSRNFILALNKRFEFVSMEGARTKSFLNNFSSTSSTHCDVCAEWCGSNDAVTCAECDKHFHMLCLDPPLPKKPSRGFSWSCALCTKKHELEHQSKKTLMLAHDNRSTNEDEIAAVPDQVALPEQSSPARKSRENVLPKYEQMAIEYLKNDAPVSVIERRLKEEWNVRYLGLHARLEEAVDPYDKSCYPRVATSLGQRYQASNIPEYEGHPIVYYDPEKSSAEKNKKKPSKKPAKKKVETDAVKELPVPKEYEDVAPKDYPQWLQPRPKGYIERGVDDGAGETCTLLWKPLESDLADDFEKFDTYVASQNFVAEKLGLHPNSPNFVDAVVKAYMDFAGDTFKAAESVSKLTRASLKEPTFSRDEIKRFEAGVKKHGSELYPVSKEVRTQPAAMVVRFYYIWKKTQRGHAIWGNFPGRKKKPSKEAEMKIKPTVDDYADSEDDSAYENEKIVIKRKTFQCKHCKSYMSQKWFKITGFDGTTVHEDTELDDVDPTCVTALCFRCARIWRRYAVYWEDPSETERKNSKGVGGYKRKVEAELAADAEKILSHARQEGVALSYDLGRVHPQSSVIGGYFRPKSTNGNHKAPPHATKPKMALEEIDPPQKADSKPSPVTKLPARARKSATSAEEPIADASKPFTPKKSKESESGKPAQSASEKPASKKRKVEVKPPPEPVKAERTKKRPAAKAESTKTKKKKASPGAKSAQEPTVKKEIEEVPKAEKQPDPKVEMKATPARRQRKNADTTVLASPLFNNDYKNHLEEFVMLSKNDKKGFAPLTKERLGQVLDEFKFRQLVDMKSLVQGWQAPQQAKIELPFAANDRNCSVCLEHDSLDTSYQEMLICSNCGVNVHGSCAGVGVAGKTKPVRQWLCDPCVNDMGPKFNTQYSCSICMAKSTNVEQAILGSPSEKPDYLVPVLESGRWCHMICALYCHGQISFRHVPTPNFIPKELTATTPTKNSSCMVESISRVFAENLDKKCGICKVHNGGLISCDLCKSENDFYHVTCAQDSPNFKLGFKLVPQRVAKFHTSTIVGDQVGRLEPILVCPKHDQKASVLQIRELGKRSSTGEARPLIQLFIEDLTRLGQRVTGPQLRAQNYISMIRTFMEKVDEQNGVSKAVNGSTKNLRECHFCKITSSPKWWPLKITERENSANGRKEIEVGSTLENGLNANILHACQRCHILGSERDTENAQREGDKFMHELNQPIDGQHYGVKGMEDRVQYVPYNSKSKGVERSKITWGDLLG